VYEPIRFLGAVSEEDADRWTSLGVRESAIAVTGDPRHDQVLERVSDLAPLEELRTWSAAGPTLVAGSVEEADEVPLLTALGALGPACAGARILLVPHETTGRVVRRLRQRARGAGVSLEVFGRDRPPTAACVVVLERGILPDLYALGSVSYVGGGFRARGLHAVVEPAAFGLPVLVGPEYAASPDAVALVAGGGAAVLPRREPAASAKAQWQKWVQHDTERSRAGLAARRTLREGAAGATARHLLSLLDQAGVTGGLLPRA
jgi:3-deoxy-D-manno-octulosonic-acid transferase